MNEGLPLRGRGAVPDEWFERTEGVPMTKAPVRSVAVSLLSPLVGERVLEIGSGTGAMTVELIRAVGDYGRVVSVETDNRAAELAARNVRRSDLAGRAKLMTGAAPGVIPQTSFAAIFIGGHGRELAAIIDVCWDRLDEGGRLLIPAITPRTTAVALECLERLGADVGFWRLHAATGRRAGTEWLLQGNNPIDFIWGDKIDG
jgi:precorrin-6Y C5,15-methyltransferase (decarboxylating) CbiT subunit